jgi:hypothetical protein
MVEVKIRKDRSIDEIINNDYFIAPGGSILVKSAQKNLNKLSEELLIDLRQQSGKVPENGWFEVNNKFSKIVRSGFDFYIGKIPHFDLDSHQYTVLPLVYAPNTELFRGEDKNWYVNLNK